MTIISNIHVMHVKSGKFYLNFELLVYHITLATVN
jgi:hypothetical protein